MAAFAALLTNEEVKAQEDPTGQCVDTLHAASARPRGQLASCQRIGSRREMKAKGEDSCFHFLRQPPAPQQQQMHEDAHEFLMFTLDAMKQACLREDKASEPQAQDATLIRQTFGGYWRSQIQCLHCQGVSSTLDPYLDISLDIRAAQSVSQALQHLVKPEQLDGENAYRCSTCLDKVPASKTLTLHTCSKVLMLVLKRFCHVTGSKLAKEVQYPERLDMRRYVSGQNGGSLTYVLYAVLVHAGWNCHSGHYFCYIKAGNGQWYKMDDAKVTASDATSALSQHAYVLFYVQKSESERDRASEPGAGESTSLQADHAGTAAAQGGPETDPNIEVPQLEDHGEETPLPAITLDQWRFLQESHRPKSELNLRKLEFALPPDAVLIHQSKYRDEMGKDHREPNIHRLNSSARDIPPQRATAINQVPCLTGRARATKRKNKKGQRSQEAVQGSHYRL
ncbi:ubiquitin carboxyl-terminal hydrolase 17-like protein 13 [Lynx rufus]|uniref:ubiquitin carboxyl-terminal hydrolase 17-like protein 13 n=1 Tax=Lynx rufus TaxID=61384 RepID=UPI001F126989|nr:ubiquitin carboxyl-terminal hydrolase 17-like protein 13 [Lynx rufus]